jgi:ABC-type multidrug transport system fused ATPase/permease subunit
LWAWMNAVVIILGLTGAVFSLSASLEWMGMKTVLGVDYRVAVRALVILVLAFTAQTIYQQVKLRKLQRELKEQHVQAEYSAGWRCSIRLPVCTTADLRSSS